MNETAQANWNSLEFVSMELTNDDQINSVVQGSTFVIHTAAPVTLDTPKDEKTIIDPCVNGCLSILAASVKFKVQRVVITSSLAAICGMAPEDRPDIFNE